MTVVEFVQTFAPVFTFGTAVILAVWVLWKLVASRIECCEGVAEAYLALLDADVDSPVRYQGDDDLIKLWLENYSDSKVPVPLLPSQFHFNRAIRIMRRAANPPRGSGNGLLPSRGTILEEFRFRCLPKKYHPKN